MIKNDLVLPKLYPFDKHKNCFVLIKLRLMQKTVACDARKASLIVFNGTFCISKWICRDDFNKM